jgi:hypothetical protein
MHEPSGVVPANPCGRYFFQVGQGHKRPRPKR